MDPHPSAPIGRRSTSRTNRTATVLTVTEAAHLLRIGRSTAYEAATRFLDGDPDGLPVIRIGRSLRVPLTAIAQLLGVSATELVTDTSGPPGPPLPERTQQTTRTPPQPPARQPATSDSLTLPGM